MRDLITKITRYLWHSWYFESEGFPCSSHLRQTIHIWNLRSEADWEYPVISRRNNSDKSGRDCRRFSAIYVEIFAALCPRNNSIYRRLGLLPVSRLSSVVATVSALFIPNARIIGGNNTSSQLNATAECPWCSLCLSILSPPCRRSSAPATIVPTMIFVREMYIHFGTFHFHFQTRYFDWRIARIEGRNAKTKMMNEFACETKMNLRV